MKSLAVVVALILVAAPLVAQQSPDDSFTVYGAGATPCRSWIDHLNDKNLHPVDLNWVFGFVSAAGVFAGVQLKTDANGIEPFMTKYCAEHSQDPITTAAANLVGELRK